MSNKNQSDSAPLFVDNTLLSAMDCDTKALMRHAFGYAATTEAPRLRAGQAAHKAVEYVLRGGSALGALEIFRDDYCAWADVQGIDPDDAVGSRSTADIIAAYLEDFRVADLPLRVEPALVEVGFQVPLVEDGRIVFCGRCDLIGQHKSDGGWYVWENKFTTRVHDGYMDAYRLNSQVFGYVWAAEQTLGVPVRGAYINAVQLFTPLPGSERKCVKHAVKFTECRSLHVVQQVRAYLPPTEHLAAWHRTAVRLASEYRELCTAFQDVSAIAGAPQQGLFRRACRWCQYKTWCESGRPLWAVDSVFTKEPWEPFPRARHASCDVDRAAGTTGLLSVNEESRKETLWS